MIKHLPHQTDFEQEWWLLKQWHRVKRRYVVTANGYPEEAIEFICGYVILLAGRMNNIQPEVPEWGRNKIHLDCEEEDDR